ncbi:hypothetical protein C0991_001112, partial [Blastosporella zonata]
AIVPALIIIRVALGFAYERCEITQDVVLTTFHDTFEASPIAMSTQGDKSVCDTL